MAFWTIAAVKAANKAIDNHFFDRDTMRFFSSKVESKLYYATQTFITSEKKCFTDYTRVYSVRRVNERGEIATLARDLRSKSDAKDFIKELEVSEAKEIGAMFIAYEANKES